VGRPALRRAQSRAHPAGPPGRELCLVERRSPSRGRADAVLAQAPIWRERLAAVDDWSAWLAEGDESEELTVLRRAAPCRRCGGSEAFIAKLEALADRPFALPPDRPPAHARRG